MNKIKEDRKLFINNLISDGYTKDEIKEYVKDNCNKYTIRGIGIDTTQKIYIIMNMNSDYFVQKPILTNDFELYKKLTGNISEKSYCLYQN